MNAELHLLAVAFLALANFVLERRVARLEREFESRVRRTVAAAIEAGLKRSHPNSAEAIARDVAARVNPTGEPRDGR